MGSGAKRRVATTRNNHNANTTSALPASSVCFGSSNASLTLMLNTSGTKNTRRYRIHRIAHRKMASREDHGDERVSLLIIIYDMKKNKERENPLRSIP